MEWTTSLGTVSKQEVLRQILDLYPPILSWAAFSFKAAQEGWG